MANKKISELTELPVAGQNDVLPIVDLAGPETKKIKVSGLKSSLSLNRSDVGLSEVDNTSDANKPVSTATQAALDLKADQAATQAELDLKADDADLQNHINDLSNPHSVTKAQVGLSEVDNTSDANKPISSATQDALDLKQDSLGFTPEDSANKGATHGYAPLVDGLVPSIYLPSYVDDVIEVADFASLPATGEISKIYVTLDDNKTYRWSGSTYVEVSPSDVNSVNGKTGVVVLDKADIGLDQVDNTSDANKPVSIATQAALNLKLNIADLPRQAQVYKPVNLFNFSSDPNGTDPADVSKWLDSSEINKKIASNQHFLTQPENYLKCFWKVTFLNEDTIQQEYHEAGPFLDIAEASSALSAIFSGKNYHIATITPYSLKDDNIPVCDKGVALNSTFHRLFKHGPDDGRSHVINSRCVATALVLNVPVLTSIFSTVYGVNPFPAQASNWTSEHYGVFMKRYKKKQITTFIKEGTNFKYEGVSQPRYVYNSSLNSFEHMNTLPDFSGIVGVTIPFDQNGNQIADRLLYNYGVRNMLDSSVHAVRLDNGSRKAILIKDYHKDTILLSGVPRVSPESESAPLYDLEAVVSDSLNNQKIYTLPATVALVSGIYRNISYNLSGIYLKPKAGSTVKFRFRDKTTNRVGNYFNFKLKIVQKGPICVVDTVPNEDT